MYINKFKWLYYGLVTDFLNFWNYNDNTSRLNYLVYNFGKNLFSRLNSGKISYPELPSSNRNFTCGCLRRPCFYVFDLCIYSYFHFLLDGSIGWGWKYHWSALTILFVCRIQGCSEKNWDRKLRKLLFLHTIFFVIFINHTLAFVCFV